MKKVIFATLALAVALASLAGCRAGVAVDPDGNASYNLPSPR